MFMNFRPIYSSLIIGTFALLISTVCWGQTKTEQLDELINTYLKYGQFNGSVLVAQEGEVIYKKGFGWANMEWDIPNTPDTKHRLGSITKQFTAMLILQLAEDGKLDLHAPITTYLPDYPEKTGKQITTHHLLVHSSGIPNYTALPGFFENQSRDPYGPEAFVELFKDKELDFTPGKQFNYSNSGYFLLGVIIEKLTGKTYEQMLHDNILGPLGMDDTGFDHHADILKNRATGYEKRGRDFVNSPYLDMSIPYSAGSMYSTVEDLYLWDQALYTNKLLTKEYMKLFFQPDDLPAYGGMNYAYGWLIGEEAIGNTEETLSVTTHGGGINGFNTNISRSISDQSLVVLLNNTGSAPLNDITVAIWAIINDKEYEMPKKSLAYELGGIIEVEGMEAGLAFYEANKGIDDFHLSENEMNQIGYRFMQNDKLEEAKQVFKLNINAFPESFNVYDSYAEALMNMGETEAAIANYRRSVEMNPGNQNGLDMLEKLGADTSDLMEEIKIPEEVLESYVGKYELMPNFIITVTKEGQQMKAQATGQPIFDIFPKSENVFYLKVVAAQVTFNKGEDGTTESLTLLQGGQEITGKRLVD